MRFTKEEKQKLIKEYSATIICFIIALLFMFFIDKGQIGSLSMEPTLKTGEHVIYERLSIITGNVKRGDIIEFKRGNEYLSKRLIGIGGDEIQIKDGYVYLNGEKLEEDYLPEGTYTKTYTQDTYKVPEGCVFLLGDNREYSADSRLWDNPYVDYKQVVGKFLFKW